MGLGMSRTKRISHGDTVQQRALVALEEISRTLESILEIVRMKSMLHRDEIKSLVERAKARAKRNVEYSGHRAQVETDWITGALGGEYRVHELLPGERMRAVRLCKEAMQKVIAVELKALRNRQAKEKAAMKLRAEKARKAREAKELKLKQKQK